MLKLVQNTGPSCPLAKAVATAITAPDPYAPISIRSQYITVLDELRCLIATTTLDAWVAPTPEASNDHLSDVQALLAQIKGSAGSLGFDTLRSNAAMVEAQIIYHLDSDAAQRATCPASLLETLDAFTDTIRVLIEDNGENIAQTAAS